MVDKHIFLTGNKILLKNRQGVLRGETKYRSLRKKYCIGLKEKKRKEKEKTFNGIHQSD